MVCVSLTSSQLFSLRGPFWFCPMIWIYWGLASAFFPLESFYASSAIFLCKSFLMMWWFHQNNESQNKKSQLVQPCPQAQAIGSLLSFHSLPVTLPSSSRKRAEKKTIPLKIREEWVVKKVELANCVKCWFKARRMQKSQRGERSHK